MYLKSVYHCPNGPTITESFKYHHKTLKKKLFLNIKHDMVIDRDMPETCHQKILIKNFN